MKKSLKPQNSLRSNVKDIHRSKITLKSWQLQPHYNKWINDLFKAYRNDEAAVRYSSLDEYLTHNGVFVTATFHRWGMALKKRNLNLRLTDTSLELDAFHRLYRDVAHGTLGNHWDNKSKANRWPLAVVAIDHPEAKYAKETTGEVTNLHWHAVIVCRSDDRSAFMKALNDIELGPDFYFTTLVDTLDVRAWDPSKDASYITKAHVKALDAATPGTEDVLIYPNPSASGRLGWGYRNKYIRSSGGLARLIAGLKREQHLAYRYARLHGAEPR